MLPAARDRGFGPRWIGWGGVAVWLTLLLLPAIAWPDGGICGYAPGGRVVFTRAGQTIAAFTVATAESLAHRRQGLMHCPALEPGTGLLFVYDEIHPRTFWMKDTPLELGILFIDRNGRITAIERGVPGSRARIRSPGPVRYVLEINHQEASKLQAGDRMRRIVPDSTPNKPGREGPP
jgi:uncharacterized membrane protein (UPF0127 family)